MILDAVGEAVATGKAGVVVGMGVAVDPPHANPVITSAAIRETDMRCFMSSLMRWTRKFGQVAK